MSDGLKMMLCVSVTLPEQQGVLWRCVWLSWSVPHSITSYGDLWLPALGCSSIFLRLSVGFLYLLCCFLLLESEVPSLVLLERCSAGGSGSPKGKVRDDRLEEACPQTRLQPHVCAGLYLSRRG